MKGMKWNKGKANVEPVFLLEFQLSRVTQQQIDKRIEHLNSITKPFENQYQFGNKPFRY